VPDKSINEVSRQARDLYERGFAALERKNLDSAIKCFDEAVKLEPGFVKARQALRQSQAQKAKGGGAVSKIFGSLGGAPALAKAMANAKKEPVKAMEEAEKALTSSPFSVQALKIIASAAEALDYPLTAISSLEAARDGNPDNVDILIELGRVYQLYKQTDKAQEVYERVLKIQPSNADAFKGLKDATANQAMREGKWEDTSGTYRDKMKDKKEAQDLENAGRIFKNEDVVRSQMNEVYNQAQLQPDNVVNWKKLGDLALQINEFDLATSYYEHAYALTQGADGNLGKAISDTKLKKVGFIVKQKEEQLKTDPENEAIKQELEELKIERERSILEECEARSKRYPNDLDIKFELGRVYFRNKMIDKAMPELQAAASNPKNKVACMYWIGQCLRDKGMLDMAAQRFKQAAELSLVMDSLKKDIVYNLGLTYEKMGKKAEMIEQFKLIYDSDVNYKDIGKRIEDYYRDQAGDQAA
jgi:tetratricopeptide (TPR) repeat protein